MKHYHKNPRQITKRQFEQLQEWLAELGDLGGIVHDLNSDECIGGNQRVRALGLDGVEPVIVERFDPPTEQGTVALGYYEANGERYRAVRWTPEQCEKANIVANRAGGEWDFDILANEWDVGDLLEWGFEPEELGIDLTPEPPADPGAQVDRAAELQEQWGTERGQVWEIPSLSVEGKCHRVMCGDSTSAEDVGRLMGGERAAMVWTDPPYGVRYGDKLQSANPMGYRVRTIENDDLPADQLEGFIRSVFVLAAKHCVDGAAIYAACPAGTPLPAAIAAFTDSGFVFRWQLVWVKDQLVLSRADYHFRHENILYGWKPGAAHYFTEERTHDSIFEIPRPKVSDEHPTMKPPELICAMLNNSSKPQNAIYEPFCGSGSTLVACEQAARIGYGMEIEPKYIAVTLQRLADMGLEPRLAEAAPA